MKEIAVLDQHTIDKIAAGEVIERPASIVKELVENAIDAGANAITTEIKDGGISLIRITDNGEGMAKEQIATAFLRHATSKITKVEDLLHTASLGFRGEALSSIAAVCQVEVITKTAGTLLGTRYCIEGGKEISSEEVGAPEGTTFRVSNVFYNTPARKKFLKTAMTEAGYIAELMERMALSHPEIAFKFISSKQTKLYTAGRSNLKEIIYGIYGRDIAANLIPVSYQGAWGSMEGFLARPVVSRGNRNFENYFINGRYVKSKLLMKAIEDGYKTFLMQHKYPFTVLHFQIEGELLDINVHPTKMELRFSNPEEIYQTVFAAVREALTKSELIPEVSVKEERKPKELPRMKQQTQAPEPFELQNEPQRTNMVKETAPYRAAGGSRPLPEIWKKEIGAETSKARHPAADTRPEAAKKDAMAEVHAGEAPKAVTPEVRAGEAPKAVTPEVRAGEAPKAVTLEVRAGEAPKAVTPEVHAGEAPKDAMAEVHAGETPVVKAAQMDLFADRLLTAENVKAHQIIGQVFDTYWIVQFQDKMYLIDQHAAHEKVLYERTVKRLKDHAFTSQRVSPPVIVTLGMKEEEVLRKHRQIFERIGFEIEHFGGKEYALSAVPDNLFGLAKQQIFIELLDNLMEQGGRTAPESMLEKIASMSCKAAVKGNHRMSAAEAHALIDELLTLDNPYNCPHGRPTIISMTKYELEKKFKRIV